MNKAIPLMFFIPFSIPLTVNAVTPCVAYSRQIEQIEIKMRLGYSVAEGEYYKKRLTELKDDRISCERELEKQQQVKQQRNWQHKQQANQKAVAAIAKKAKPSQWTSTTPSTERLKHWQQLQQQENQKFEQLKQQYQGIIKPAETTIDPNAAIDPNKAISPNEVKP